MPVYEYFCPNCKSKFELLRPISRINDDAFCPRCNTRGEKVFSCFASFSKGSEGISTPVGGSGRCTGCTAASCSSCI